MGLPEEFLNAFDIKFNSNGEKNLIFRCSFVIINYQPPAFDCGVPIYDSRFWSTKIFEGFYFNEFVKFPLIQKIRKRITIDGETGSSWRFSRFQSISISVNMEENQYILW